MGSGQGEVGHGTTVLRVLSRLTPLTLMQLHRGFLVSIPLTSTGRSLLSIQVRILPIPLGSRGACIEPVLCVGVSIGRYKLFAMAYTIIRDDPTPDRGSQLPRAASLIVSSLGFIHDLRKGILDPDSIRGKALDMSQYKRLFGTARIPTEVAVKIQIAIYVLTCHEAWL